MLRRGAQLTAYVVLAHLAQEGVVLIRHNVVKANAGAYEHLFDALDFSKLAQKLQVSFV